MAKRVIKSKKLEANTVKLAVIGGDTYSITLNGAATLGSVLKEAMPRAWRRDGSDVRVNNEPAADEYALKSGDVISVIPRVVGGVR